MKALSPATEILRVAANLRRESDKEKQISKPLSWSELTEAQKVYWIIKANKILELF